MTRILFAVLLIAAFGMFAWTVWRFARLMFSAKPLDRTDRVGDRINSASVDDVFAFIDNELGRRTQN